MCPEMSQEGAGRACTVGSGQGHAGRVWVVGSGQGHAGQVRKTVWTWREEAELVRGTLRIGREDDMDGL